MSAPGASPPMTPERWRAVDAVLQAALACEPDRREAFVVEACGGDEGLRHEVTSLLAAFDGATDGFLERPAADALVVHSLAGPLDARLAEALGGHYAVEGEIARGGMAAVYLARDLRHDRRVAIKVLREEVAAAVGAERFLEEIRVTASLQHPHILPLFDSGSAGGLLWYVMPFVDGETLRARLARERRLGVAEAVRLAREVADALEYAHRHGVVHRDVKPENILLQDGHALVADFGIALALEHAGGERLTRTGLTLGTPQYMAPEQATGERGIDERADVYALGAVLHEMLAGEPPFAAATRQAVVQRLMHEPPTALAATRADVPPSVDGAVRRALEKRPEARFATAAAFADALDTRWTASGEPERDARGGARGGARTVAARVAAYALLFGLTVGLAGGWALARSSLVQRWTASPAAAAPGDPGDNAVATAPNAPAGGLSLVVVDRAGRVQREIAANRPWTPRFSPNGKWVAYGAFGAGRSTSDIFLSDLTNGTTRRLTDDDGDSNDPQWSADGTTVAYSVNAPGGKDIAMRSLKGGVAPLLASRPGTQFASDWLRDGSALLVTDDAGPDGRHDILVQPADGSAARPLAATEADETAGRASPDGRWVAYTSDASGREEVYLESFARPGKRVMISQGGGRQPVWRGDGRELYYWRGDELVAVHFAALNGDAPPTLDAPSVLFRAPVEGGMNTMYDVSPDGQRFVIVRHQ